MDLKQIKELMSAMERAGFKKISIKEKTGFELQLERHEENPPHAVQQPHHPPFTTHHQEQPARPMTHPHVPHRSPAEEGTAPKEMKVEGRFVTSPMVGTYYASPSPDDPHFIKVGDRVEENTVVCIIEAMKVMNEVKAGISGVVAEILVDNGHPVEFGTKMIRIV